MTNASHPHLTPEAAAQLGLSVDERVAAIEVDRWVAYPEATDILRWMDDLIAVNRIERKHSLLILSDSDNGKTSLLRRFERKHRSTADLEPTGTMPLLRIEMPTDISETRLYSLLLMAAMAPHNPRDTAFIKETQLTRVMTGLKVRGVIIDEFSNVLYAGAVERRKILGTLKIISAQLKVSIIATGVHEAVQALRGDPHLFSRFDIAELPRWELNRDFLRFLLTYQSMLPLAEDSQLTDSEKSALLHEHCRGLIGPAVSTMNAAAVHALREGREAITTADLREVMTRRPSVKSRYM